jgi:hypothetical protein
MLFLRGATVTATASGGSGPVSLTLIIGSTIYQNVSTSLGIPYSWGLIPGQAGQAVTVMARTSDGRQAVASLILR